MSFTAVITGASTGIGEATARRVAREPGAELLLVARRGELLEQLAGELSCPVHSLPLDLTSPEAPARVRDAVERHFGGRLHLLVNTAGAAWRGTFSDTGWANVERHMRLNFEAPVRLIEALLPVLRSTASASDGAGTAYAAPVSIVNVASTAGRVSRPNSGAYSASKFALAGWSDALHGEEAPHGVHVGLVLPGFIKTEGFPAAELTAKVTTRWLVSEPEAVAEAIWEAGPGGRAERYVPRPYFIPAVLRVLLPRLVRRSTAGGAFTTATKTSSD
ncbi:MAG TPA: SDR family NAD(P)-dependent oxidoreductase [Solirubrobacteraceae bacterium]|nr:SDR family NAD(P)-dependent oxidoreductase [Solirubrobacteraceae bacterium]